MLQERMQIFLQNKIRSARVPIDKIEYKLGRYLMIQGGFLYKTFSLMLIMVKDGNWQTAT